VTLRQTSDSLGSRYLGACLTPTGDLRVDGQDLGDGVEEFFGPGLREYEWVYTVQAQHLPLLVAALGGRPGDDVLDLLVRTCSGPDAVRLRTLLGQGGPVPADLWTRVGD
jgi:hypothetical protein